MYITRCLIFIYIFVFVSCKELNSIEQFITSKKLGFQIINPDLKLDTSPENIVLINDSVNNIFETWNHIHNINNEWKGITKSGSNYNVSKKRNVFSKSFNSIIVKKYGDWEHQHANGYVLKPIENNITIASLNKIILDIYYDSDLSSIPNLEKIKSVYGHLLSDTQIENWDNGLFNFDIQIYTKSKNTLAMNVTLKRELSDRWLRIEVPIKNMQCWNKDRQPIGLKNILVDTIQSINLTAETKSRLVYRNLDTKKFNTETTPKLFKEMAVRIKRFELEKK
ncbi:hypothetical protein [Thalassobellus citreus]|uniref:hypothetical protein n=1 Tax=Thalassobellus citreus TaxID=3367752 RepID=UPI0037B5A0BB